MIKFTESNNKTMAALTAGGQLTIETNRRWFDVIVSPMLGVVTLKSKERGKTWDEAELICKAEECLHLVDEALHDLECYDDEAPENEEDPLERFTRNVEKLSEQKENDLEDLERINQDLRRENDGLIQENYCLKRWLTKHDPDFAMEFGFDD